MPWRAAWEPPKQQGTDQAFGRCTAVAGRLRCRGGGACSPRQVGDGPSIDFRSVLDTLADAVVAADEAQRIVYVNAAADRLLGWERGELVGRPLTTIMPERMHAAHRAGFARFLRTREPRVIGRSIRVPVRTKQGAEAEIELTLAAAPRDGELLFVGSLRELGGRVELERQLAVTRYLRAATAAAAKLTAELDADRIARTAARILVDDFDAALARVWCSDRERGVLRLRGSAGSSEEIDRSSRSVVDPETYKIGSVARSREPFVKNGLAGDPELDAVWIEREGIVAAAIFPLVAAGGVEGVLACFFRRRLDEEVAEVLGTLATIVATALHEASVLASQRAAHRRFQDLVDGMDHGVVWEAEPDMTRFSFVSARTEDVTGWPKHRWLEERGFWEAHVHEDDRAAVMRAFADVAEGRGARTVDHRFLRGDGRVAWLRTTARLARLPGDVPILRGISIDMTAARRAEDLSAREARDAALRADVGTALAKSDGVRELCARCAEAFVRHLGAAIACIWTVDPDDATLELQASAGAAASGDIAPTRIPMGERAVGRIASEGKPYLTNEVASGAVVRDPSWARREDLVAFAGYPLSSRAGLVGVAALFATRPLGADVLAALEAAAVPIAEAIERARTAEALRDREAWLTTALRSIGDGVIATGADGRVLLMNRIAEELTGWPLEEARGEPLDRVLRIVDGRDRDVAKHAAEHAPREGEATTIPRAATLLPRGGKPRAIEDCTAPICDESGRTRGAIVVFRDVTAKREAERRRRLVEEATAALVGSLDYEETLATVARLAVPELADICIVDVRDERGGDDGFSTKQVAVADADPERSEYVRAMRERFPPDPHAEMGPMNVMRTGRSELIADVTDEMLARAARSPEHFDVLRRFGLRSLIAAPMRARGRTLGAMTFLSAESGRRYAEDDVHVAEELAARAALAMDNARLYREAQEAVQARDVFLLVAAHELRTPLTSALLQVQSLRRMADALPAQAVGGRPGRIEVGTPALERLAAKTATMERQVGRLAALVEELLDISRVTSGRLRVHPEPIDLSRLVREVVTRLGPQLVAAGCTVELRRRARDGRVGSEPARAAHPEPPDERAEVRRGRADRRDRDDRGRPARAPRRARPRHRHRPARPDAHLRAVRARGVGAPLRGARDGPLDREADRGGPRRVDPRGEQAGRGRRVHGGSAARRTLSTRLRRFGGREAAPLRALRCRGGGDTRLLPIPLGCPACLVRGSGRDRFASRPAPRAGRTRPTPRLSFRDSSPVRYRVPVRPRTAPRAARPRGPRPCAPGRRRGATRRLRGRPSFGALRRRGASRRGARG